MIKPRQQKHPVLVLFAHPALEKSRVNRGMMDAIAGLDGVTVQDLYEEYPDFDINVEREQKLAEQHDVIVLQHPLYWYSTPALLKQWEDLVLEHGWAYGNAGKALVGKLLVSAVSTGGKADAYSHAGFHQKTLLELLAPIKQTARICGMQYLPPFVAHDAFHMDGGDIDAIARGYRGALEALRDGTVNVDRALRAESLNAALKEQGAV